MVDLFERATALYGAGLEVLYTGTDTDEIDGSDVTVETTLIGRFTADHGLRFPMRALFQKRVLVPGLNEGWGRFLSEEARGQESTEEPHFAFAAFEPNEDRARIILTGVAVISSGIPDVDFDREIFDPHSKPWVCLATDDSYGALYEGNEPLADLIRIVGKDLHERGADSFYTIVDAKSYKDFSYCGLPAKPVEQIDFEGDESIVVLAVRLRRDQAEMLAIWERFLGEFGPDGEDILEEGGGPTKDEATGQDRLDVFVDSEEEGDQLPEFFEGVPVYYQVGDQSTVADGSSIELEIDAAAIFEGLAALGSRLLKRILSVFGH